MTDEEPDVWAWIDDLTYAAGWCAIALAFVFTMLLAAGIYLTR